MAWFVLVAVLGAKGAFLTPIGTPPIPIALGILVPIFAFLSALRLSPAFRDAAFAADSGLLSSLQAWRFGGFVFLALYAHGILPAMFAIPAGVGDMAVGLSAPWIASALRRDPGFARSRAFVWWNLFGLLDFTVAVGLGTMSSMLASGAFGEITSRPMAEPPLLLIPGFLVPLLAMLHILALMRARIRA